MAAKTSGFECEYCHRICPSYRSYSAHTRHCEKHYNYHLKLKQQQEQQKHFDEINYCDGPDFDFADNYHDNNDNNDNSLSFINQTELDNDEFKDCDASMLNSAIDFQKSGMFRHHDTNPQFKSSVHLLELLKQHKCDLSLFDKIVNWAKIS